MDVVVVVVLLSEEAVAVLSSEEAEEVEWRRGRWLDQVEEEAEGEEGDRMNFSSLLQSANVDYIWQEVVMGLEVILVANMAGQALQAQVT